MSNLIFQHSIKYEFNNPDLLETALTHSSYSSEDKKKGIENNEKLEFLGDAFLDAIISEHLYLSLRTKREGALSKIRASIVCEKSLSEIGKELEVGKYLRMGKGEELTGGRNRDSIIADAMEAIIGAIYLDRGYLAAQSFVLAYFERIIQEALEGRGPKDYKTKLQEKIQAGGDAELLYVLDQESGPAHDKTFSMKLYINGAYSGQGNGKNKKEAEQAAAKDALERGGKVVF